MLRAVSARHLPPWASPWPWIPGGGYSTGAPMPKQPLYVYGKMPATAMQHRLAALVCGMFVPPHTLKIWRSSRRTCSPVPCRIFHSVGAGHAGTIPQRRGYCRTLCRAGKENEASHGRLCGYGCGNCVAGVWLFCLPTLPKDPAISGTSTREGISWEFSF